MCSHSLPMEFSDTADEWEHTRQDIEHRARLAQGPSPLPAGFRWETATRIEGEDPERGDL
jgi:hypothetical protein